MALEKVETGIPGVDEMLGGGLPKGSVSIISGSPGVGKSSFAMQFLMNGIERGEPGVYLTVEELAMYDGSGDNPAYIAYEGNVYDVSNVAAWSGGSHNGVSAGTDITAAIANAPHGTNPIDGLTLVGELLS